MKTKLLILLFVLCICNPAWSALTKTTALDIVDDWTLVATSTLVVGNAEDISSSYGTVLYIEAALTSSNAQAGADLIVETSYADDNWVELITFKTTAETPASSTINDGAVTAGDTTLTLTDATTGDFDVPGRKWFILDGTVANSESVKTVTNATHTVTVAQDLLRSHADGLAVYDRVDEWQVSLPFPASWVRVLVNNTDTDATIHFTSRVSKVSALN